MQKWNKKLKIVRQAKNLKGTDIWIGDDYPKKVQEERKNLIPYLKRARQEGKNASIRYNKLIINGSEYAIECCEDEESERKNENKRTMSERSPENDKTEQHLRKIKLTVKKN